MEQLHHIIIMPADNLITFCGDRGSQKSLQFHVRSEFVLAVQYCQQRLSPKDIYYY